jgi:hypothetical protein
LDSGAFHESRMRSVTVEERRGEADWPETASRKEAQPHGLPRSGLVFFGLGFHVAYAPRDVPGTPLQSFHLPKKLCGECRFAPEPLIAGFAPQAHSHVARSRLKGTP